MAFNDPNDPAIAAALFGQPVVPELQTGLGEGYTLAETPEETFVPPLGDPSAPPTIANQMAGAAAQPQPRRVSGGFSVGGGGGGESVARSTSTPVIVEKRRSGERRPTDSDAQAASIGDQEAVSGAAQRQADAVSAQADAEAAYLQSQADAAAQAAEFDRQAAETRQRADLIANQEADQRIAGIQGAVEAAASMRVDPNRIWTENGAANRTSGIVAAFIGGFLQPVLGVNTIQQQIDKAIDRDIAAQRSDIEGAQRNIGNLRQLHALGLQQAETEAEQREQDRLLRRASLVGLLSAETLKMQDRVLRAKAEAQVAALNAQNTKELIDIRNRKKQELYGEYVKEEELALARQRVAVQRQAARNSYTLGRANLAMRQAEVDAKNRAAAGAAEAERRKLQLNPQTSGLRMQDGTPVTMRNKEEFNKTSEQLRSLTDLQTKAEALKNVLAGRLAVPGQEITARQKAAFSELIQGGGMKLSSQMSNKDVAIIKNARGGELDEAIRLYGDDVVIKVLEDFQAQKAGEGRALARTLAPPGQSWVYDPIIDERVITDIAGSSEEPKVLGIEQHAAKISSDYLSPEDKAEAIMTFLNSAQDSRGGLLLTKKHPQVREIMRIANDPEVVKHLPESLIGVEGEGKRVQVGRNVQDELRRIYIDGSARGSAISDRIELDQRAREEMENLFGLRGR